MTLVKICGITRLEDALAAAEAGADAIGLNFCPQSPRFVSAETAAAIVAALPPTICRVGVFVDADRRQVEELAERLDLTALQFHGSELPGYCRGWKRKVIKALRLRDAESAAAARRYEVAFVLADAYVEGRQGGTGQPVRRELLAGLDRARLILAGGLDPDNVAEAVRAVRPAGVDVASGVESAPGIKDHERVRKFIAHAKSA